MTIGPKALGAGAAEMRRSAMPSATTSLDAATGYRSMLGQWHSASGFRGSAA